MGNALSDKHLRQSISFPDRPKGERAKAGSGKQVVMFKAESLVKQGLAWDVSRLLSHYPNNFLTLQLSHKITAFAACGSAILRRNVGSFPSTGTITDSLPVGATGNGVSAGATGFLSAPQELH